MKLVNPKKPVEMFIKAGIFGVFFLIVLIFFMIASKNVKSVETGSKILNGVTRYKGFSEKEKDDLKLRNAGFWEYESETAASIRVVDRIELKSNGIFWRIFRYSIDLPSGDSTRFIHISTGYLNPFCKLGAHNTDSIICDVRTIKQSYIMGKDTCYGAANIDTTWNLVANGKRFELGRRIYSAYDTTGPGLIKFFPAGALDIVDKHKNKAYMVGNKTVFLVKNQAQAIAAAKSKETFDFCQCPAVCSFESFAQKAIASDMSTVKVDSLTTEAAQKTIDAYYRVFIEATMKNGANSSAGESGNAKVIFDIDRNGKVTNAAVVKLSKKDNKLEHAILSDIMAWTFPQCQTSKALLHIEREFWF